MRCCGLCWPQLRLPGRFGATLVPMYIGNAPTLCRVGDLGLSALFSDVSGARNSETHLLAGEEMQRALAHTVIRRTCRFVPRKKKKKRRRETA